MSGHESDGNGNGRDPIDELFRQAAARSAFDELTAGKTPDERQDVVIGMLCRTVGELSAQNDALARMMDKATAVIAGLERRLEAAERRLTALEAEGLRGVRGPFIRRIPHE